MSDVPAWIAHALILQSAARCECNLTQQQYVYKKCRRPYDTDGMMYLPGACDIGYWELVAVHSFALLHALLHLGPVGHFPDAHHQRTLHAECTTQIGAIV